MFAFVTRYVFMFNRLGLQVLDNKMVGMTDEKPLLEMGRGEFRQVCRCKDFSLDNGLSRNFLRFSEVFPAFDVFEEGSVVLRSDGLILFLADFHHGGVGLQHIFRASGNHCSVVDDKCLSDCP